MNFEDRKSLVGLHGIGLVMKNYNNAFRISKIFYYPLQWWDLEKLLEDCSLAFLANFWTNLLEEHQGCC